MNTPLPLTVQPLTAKGFAAFGEVIAPESAREVYPINNGTSIRYHDLARLQTLGDQSRLIVSIFRAEARRLPFTIEMLERHPLGSQAFVPLNPALRYLVVVGQDAEQPPRAFLAEHGAGINFAPGCWHHPLLAFDAGGDFLVIDRAGPGENCEELRLARSWQIDAPTLP